MEKFISEVLNRGDVSAFIESYKHGRLRKDSNNIWCELDMKDKRFKLSEKEYFLNYTLELVSSHFQVSVVFPLFPSIIKLKKILSEKEKMIINQFIILTPFLKFWSNEKLKIINIFVICLKFFI